MKRCILGLIFLFLSSCKPSKLVVGKYQATGKDYIYTLLLENNKTFLLVSKGFEYNSKCQGKWSIKKDTIMLNCNEEKDIAVMLQSGYMSKRLQKAVVLNNRKIKLGQVILSRISN